MSRPTRHDLVMTSGSSQEFEFQLLSNGVPLDISSQIVEMYVSRGGMGTPYSFKLTSTLPHFNGPEGKVRFTVTSTLAPSRTYMQMWWYEIWIDNNKPHDVGELKVLPTNKA
jgi:hypothetical protein